MPGTVQGTLHIFSFNPHTSFNTATTIIPLLGIFLTNNGTEGQNVTFPEVKPRFEFRLFDSKECTLTMLAR